MSRDCFQTIGPCDVRAVDLAGHERQVYLCKETQDEDFTLVCNFILSKAVFTLDVYECVSCIMVRLFKSLPWLVGW